MDHTFPCGFRRLRTFPAESDLFICWAVGVDGPLATREQNRALSLHVLDGRAGADRTSVVHAALARVSQLDCAGYCSAALRGGAFLGPAVAQWRHCNQTVACRRNSARGNPDHFAARYEFDN